MFEVCALGMLFFLHGLVQLGAVGGSPSVSPTGNYTQVNGKFMLSSNGSLTHLWHHNKSTFLK